MIISPSAISPYKIPTFQSGGAPFVGLLDLYPNAAAAYSVRRLSSTYAGSAMEVRRSSDNALQDIGFDIDGNLDTASLLSFVGAGNGFVRTWYDQSGNGYNFQQTTTSNQPQIVASGVVDLLNFKPSISFLGNEYLSLSNPFSNANIMGFMSASLNNNSAILECATNISFGLSNGFRFDRLSFLRFGTNKNFTFQVNTSTSQQLLSFYNNSPTNRLLAVNNTETITNGNNPINYTGVTDFYIGVTLNIANFLEGKTQEIVLYENPNISNYSAIKGDINTYFSIY